MGQGEYINLLSELYDSSNISLCVYRCIDVELYVFI